MDNEILKNLIDSIQNHDAATTLMDNSKSSEKSAIYSILFNRGIILGETHVRNKETNRIGVLCLVEDGYTPGYFYTFKFYPICKDGQVSKNSSWKDSPRFGSYFGINNITHTPEHRAERVYSELESMADMYEVVIDSTSNKGE